MVSLITLALFASSAIAGPVARRQVPDPIYPDWTWQVENWEAGCSRSGCYYLFNVTVPSVEGKIAGVKAYCQGYEQGYENSFTKPSTYTDCRILEGVNNGVAARLSLREQDGNGFGPKNIQVSFLKAPYYDISGTNYTALHEAKYNQFVSPPLNFTMVPVTALVVPGGAPPPGGWANPPQ
ncbi:hypothetical protein PtrSN002B_011204 [Pyrenophora tritici-repentis]|uniref:Uncharacterized protein n=2 Tax=Pyrenophora tritici-repentis TaxID=45151 RepID=A0A2W1FEY1_9PLEO|nr:uncharacterized protein PTRG_10528 [Pyrenophora tritici-repentis Pt-1C-BFP]KAA8621180.1 hypothetical protein PtrV1_05681 [Pyrenophora tritici-repentis]EDU43578.1 conserved hypothetical protein [Pyrenophora tritici-repentis Pt-1C-BFP]KAF7450423.1 hypothetical protein A1F99_050390 [Pyrenophora tritici-repentis]KAF7573028.1 hypothetical protein PtrM4_079330 [Pyrenophora tritici-repentis]KAG9381350.1 hypothetical protein A1F94_008670 [Pyrenophora tritici-repentis]